MEGCFVQDSLSTGWPATAANPGATHSGHLGSARHQCLEPATSRPVQGTVIEHCTALLPNCCTAPCQRQPSASPTAGSTPARPAATKSGRLADPIWACTPVATGACPGRVEGRMAQWSGGSPPLARTPAMNRLNPRKLLLSKWTAAHPAKPREAFSGHRIVPATSKARCWKSNCRRC
jgi:hypothetical protein